jgi:hypothetical protein
MNEWMNDRVMNYINYSITQIAMNKRVTMKHSRTHIVMKNEQVTNHINYGIT